MKKNLTMGIMAMFVASAISGCEEVKDVPVFGSGEPSDTFTVSSPEQCQSIGAGTKEQCEQAFMKAQDEHKTLAPKYILQSSCEETSGVMCQETKIDNGDGTSSSVFMPMLAGMIVGNMMNGLSSRAAPVYVDERDKDRRVTAGGIYVPVGKGYAGSNIFSKPTSFSRPNINTSVPVMTPKGSSSGFAIGGFGSTGRGSTGGG